jgi:hypothetical protein
MDRTIKSQKTYMENMAKYIEEDVQTKIFSLTEFKDKHDEEIAAIKED